MIGRILYAAPFGVFAFMHFLAAEQLKILVPAYFPGDGAIWVRIVGVIFLLAFLSLLTQKYTKDVCYLLAFALLILILTVDAPGLRFAVTRQASAVMLLKDLGLLGAALFIAAVSKGRKIFTPEELRATSTSAS